MATSLTVNQVYNLAIDLIGETPGLPGQSTPYTRFLERNYDPTVERLIRSYDWNFARTSAVLEVDATTPDFEWGYRFRIPSGWLRVLPPREGGYRNGRPMDHEVSGDYIYTNIGGPLKVRGLLAIREPGRWDAMFAGVVQYDLALQMAHKFTGKVSYVDRLTRARYDAVNDAKDVGAIEGDLPEIDDLDIIRNREIC